MYAPTSTNSPGSGPTSGDDNDDFGGLTDFDGAGEILRSWGNGLRPDPDLTVSEWVDRHRMLSGRASAEPGRYRTVRTPFMREIMDRLSPGDPAQRVVFMKAAQVGATEAGNNWIGFAIHQAPGPMLAVQPTVELAKRNSRQRIDPLIDESPELRERVKPARSRDAGNTMLSKEFAGGILIMTGANSAVGLRSTPARYIFLDEVDACRSRRAAGQHDGHGELVVDANDVGIRVLHSPPAVPRDPGDDLGHDLRMAAMAQDLPTSPYLPLAMAMEAANTALEACASEGHSVSVAIVARDGNTKVLLKADNSGPHTASSATGKAFASAGLGRDTAGLAEFIAGNPQNDGLRDMDPRLVIQAGGLPIRIGGAIVGGIGVGGAPSGAIDAECARTGLDAIGAE